MRIQVSIGNIGRNNEKPILLSIAPFIRFELSSLKHFHRSIQWTRTQNLSSVLFSLRAVSVVYNTHFWHHYFHYYFITAIASNKRQTHSDGRRRAKQREKEELRWRRRRERENMGEKKKAHTNKLSPSH